MRKGERMMKLFLNATRRITLTLVLISMLLTATGALAAPAASPVPDAENKSEAPAGLSAAEWAQIKSQLPPPPAVPGTQEAYLKASNAEADDRFGGSVAISGDTLVVGARQEDSSASGGESDNSSTDAGAAYVFTRSDTTGEWTQQAYLKASNAVASDNFGHSVSIDGDTLVVSAPYGSSGVGAVYVFTSRS